MKSNSFPCRLFQLLEHADKSPDLQAIISWQPHGRSFLIKDKKRLENEVLPLFFATAQYDSFRRSLNFWGFVQIRRVNSPDFKSYYHKSFLRTRIDLCLNMKRQKPGTIVSSAILGSSCPLFEPKFHEMEWLPTTASSLQEDQIQEQTSFGAGGAAKPDTPSGVCGQAHPFAPSYSNIPCCTDVGNFAVKILKTSSDFVSVYRSGMIKDTITGAAAMTATRERTSSTDKGKSSCLDDHNEQRCIEVTPLLDNADHSEVWDESNDLNLWQNFLNQQKSLLPNNLSELNSVFD